MEILIIKFIMTYLFFATILLFNLLCNPNVEWTFINKKTGEVKEVPSWITVYFCFYWIVTIPTLILKNIIGGKDNES